MAQVVSPPINAVTGEPQSASGWSVDDPADASPGAPALKQGSPLAQPTVDQTELGRQEYGIAKAQQPYYDKLNKILSTPQTATAHLEKIRDAPNPQDYQRASLQYGGAMALIGAIGAAFARKAGNASLKAFGAAIKGWNEGNLQAYEQASQAWEQATKQTILNNHVELEKYKEILENKRLNIDQMTAGITVAAAQYQNKIIYEMAKSGNFAGVAAAVDKLNAANQRLENGYGQLSGFRQDQRQEYAGQIEALNADPEGAWNLKQTNPTKWFAISGAANAMHIPLNDPQEPPNVGGSLDANAERYRQTGTLPPNMGRGVQGYNHAQQIIQRATELETAAGGDPKEWPTKWQQYKATGAGLSREQSAISGRAGNVALAVDEADRTIPMVRMLAQAHAGQGLAVWNVAENQWKIQSGDRGFAQYVAQMNSLINIYGRVLSGGLSGTVSDKEHARGMLNPNMPLSAVQGSLDAFSTEVSIAQTAPERVRAAIAKRQQNKTPPAQEVTPPAGGGDTGNIPPPPAGFEVQP